MGPRGALESLLELVGLTWEFSGPAVLTLLAVVCALVWASLGSQGATGSKTDAARRGHMGADGPIRAEDLEPDWDLNRQELDAPEYPHLEGGFVPPTQLLYNNAPEPFPFENENCRGYFLPLHRPTYDKALDSRSEYPYGDHFKGKRRLWEMRFQLSFKSVPDDLLFGVELECFVPLSSATKRAMDFTVATLRQIVGDALYHSLGDDPNKVDGEPERPAFMMPLWAFDQLIVTPEGELPPSLSDPNLAEMGEVRVNRIREYKRSIESLDLRIGPTYTFCFWGISRFFDVLHWRVQGIPLITPLDMNQYCGKPPIYVSFYTLKPLPPESRDKRHLQSRKQYYLRCGFWSSEKRPTPDVIRRLVQRPPSVKRVRSAGGGEPNDMEPVSGSLLSCCYERS